MNKILNQPKRIIKLFFGVAFSLAVAFSFSTNFTDDAESIDFSLNSLSTQTAQGEMDCYTDYSDTCPPAWGTCCYDFILGNCVQVIC